MIHYLWWIPAAIVLYLSLAWLSVKSQELGGIYFWALALMPVPLWAAVTRVSENLLIDGVIYDVILLLSFMGGFIMLGVSSGFTLHQYIGLVLAILGIILMKI